MLTWQRLQTSRLNINSHQAGISLLELLIAGALTLILLAGLYPLLNQSTRAKIREDQYLTLQQTVRAAAEVIAQDAREAAGPRVVDSSVPLGLSASNASEVTLMVAAIGSDFAIPYQATYVGGTLPVVEPNAQGNACGTVFSGNEYIFIINNNATFYQRVEASSPCSAGSLTMTGTPGFFWTPNAYLTRFEPVRYFLGTDPITAEPALFRQVAGAAAQVVAFDITDFVLEYSADGALWTSTPPVAPQSTEAIRFTLAGETPMNLPGKTVPGTFEVSQTVFMRQTTIPPR